MQKIWSLIILLIILSACREEAKYTPGKYNSATIYASDLKLTEVKVIDWKVGPGFKTVISKGFQLVFNLPLLSNEAANELYEKQKVNGWVLRVIKNGARGRRVLGYMYYPIKHSGKGRLSFGGQQIKNGAIRVFYAAASMSSRFRSFKCPAFEHNLKIEGIKITDEGPARPFLVSSVTDKRIPGKIEKFSLRPIIFNGEMRLSGSYSLELALYNVEGQLRKSNFVKIPGEVIVTSELPVVIKGCQGATIPPRQDKPRRGIFRFGR